MCSERQGCASFGPHSARSYETFQGRGEGGKIGAFEHLTSFYFSLLVVLHFWNGLFSGFFFVDSWISLFSRNEVEVTGSL